MEDIFGDVHVITRKMVNTLTNNNYEIFIYVEYSNDDDKGFHDIIMKNISESEKGFWHQFYCILAQEYSRNLKNKIL